MEHFFIPFDCETGGLDPKTSDVLTLYMAVMDESFKVLDEVDLKLKPDNGRLPIATSEALRVNGIDIQKHLADPETITYSQAKEKILVMLKKYHKKVSKFNNLRPFGQNVQFDIDYILEYILTKEEYTSVFHYGKIDTKIIVDFLKDAGWFSRDLGSLGSIASYLGISLDKAHNAKADTLAAVEVYKKILEIMVSKKDGGQSMDLISLLEQE